MLRRLLILSPLWLLPALAQVVIIDGRWPRLPMPMPRIVVHRAAPDGGVNMSRGSVSNVQLDLLRAATCQTMGADDQT